MAEKELEYYLAQARRIAKHREKNAEKEIRKQYKELLKDLQHFMAEEYAALAEDDKLTYEILHSKAQFARFIEEIEQRVNVSTPASSVVVENLVKETYKAAWEEMNIAVEMTVTPSELKEALKGLRSVSPEVIQKAVENPVSGLTLKDTLEKNRKNIIYDIKRQVGIGLSQGDRYSTMAKRIAKSVDGDYQKAIRIARTESHRVQEAGFLDSANEIDTALKDGVTDYRMTKTWKTMQDERVRTKYGANHAKMDGVTIGIDEEFDLGNGVKTSAPSQSGSAKNDINCRCYLSYKLAEVIKEVKGKYAKLREEFQKANDVAGQYQIVKQSGKEFLADLKAEASSNNKRAKINEIDAEIKSLKTKQMTLRVECESYDARIKYSLNKGLSPTDKELLKLSEAKEKKIKETEEVRACIQEKIALKREVERGKQSSLSDTFKKKLAEVRELGGSDANKRLGYKLAPDNESSTSDKKMQEIVKKAMQNYPSEWADASSGTALLVKKADRGYYSHGKGTIAISYRTDEQALSTAYHELGHRFERAVPDVMRMETQFYKARTAGEKTEKLSVVTGNSSYRANEITKKDNFLKPYMGKYYSESGPYELVSMGFEMAYTDIETLLKDEDYAEFIFGVLTIC